MRPRSGAALLLTLVLLLSGCGGPGSASAGSASAERSVTVSQPEKTSEPDKAPGPKKAPKTKKAPVPKAPEYPQYRSKTDRDGDGVDDQTDILANVKAYIRTEPEYRSVYYASGYPEDGYGVCTDVVGYGLRHAGYDLMALVAEDIRANPGDYDITTPDRNIDFRRVPNLKIYFDHTATSLTTALDDPEAWQGGDIVVFRRPNHIGVVSDKRDPRGLPYVFHHVGKRQKRYEDYEEDMLPKWRKHIVGHYRIG